MSVKDCKRCRLWKTRTNIVWGRGDINAIVKFVGEAPGRDEDRTGTPFTGRSGTLLNGVLIDLGGMEIFKKIFITNVIMCRPPNNRRPLPDEIEACGRWLRYKIKIKKPRVIVCLGRTSSDLLIGNSCAWNKQYKIKGSIYIPVYHPSYVIRNGSKGEPMKKFRQGIRTALKLGKIIGD